MKTNINKRQVTQGDKSIRKTGIDIIGDVPWGTHFCQFYQTKEDLIEMLVPYFKAGLENNEFCMWITFEPLGEAEAKKAMRKAVPDFDQHLKRGQIEIVPHTEWYLKDGAFNLQRVLDAWIDKLTFALAKGYDGIRVTGNTAWLEKRQWRSFADYEEEINNVIGKYRMMAICTYWLDKCGASEVIDVVSNHQFALIRREGKWELIESSERKRAEESLRESEEKWRSLVKNAPNIIIIVNRDSTIQFINRTISPLTIEETIGKSIYDYIEPEHHNVVRETIEHVLQTGGPGRYEIRGVGPHGRSSWYETQVGPIKHDEQIVAVTLIPTDITERKRAEEEKNKLWHDLNERMKELNCLYEMAKIVEIPKISLEEIFQKTVDVIPPAWQYPDITCAKITVEGQEFKTPNYKDTKWKQSADIRAYGKKVGVVEVCCLEEKPEHDEGPFMKEERNLIEVITERLGHTTERKRAEEQIAYQAQLLAIVSDAVVASDAQYRLTAWNATAESMYGWKAEEVLGRFGLDITRTEYPGVDKTEMLRAIAERGSWRGEATQAHKDGTRFPVEVSSVVLRDTTGKVTGFVSVNRDITERKRSEEEIRKKNEELEAFVYMVSHDLKNPVVSIQGFCSSILKNQRGELNEKTLFYLQRVQANASLMTSLLEDLVELSRIGRIEDKKTEISVQQVIKSVWDGASRSLPTGDVEFILPKNLPRVLYSEKRLYQIFSNLLSNALKFRDEDRKTKVEIGHQEDKDNYTFFVRDNGIGIEQKYHNNIFESFSQLKDIKSEGTGMGLAIVKKIVEANQGKVWVESQKKAGSTFCFTIPKNV